VPIPVLKIIDSSEVKAYGRSLGLDAIGIAPATPFTETRRALEVRKDEGLHAGMEFTYRNPAKSTDPGYALPGAKALVVAALAYPTEPERATGGAGPVARVAAYARADHYGVLKQALSGIAGRLKAEGWRARVVSDDNALVDREAAYRAGIGWYGKNSNLLLPERGSWFVLGSVITTAPLTPDEAPLDDGCGACRRCLDGCPTGAIVRPGVVDARRCLSWLLQQPGDFPEEYRVVLGDRIYGCDDCQEVCPQNRSATATEATPDGSTWVPILDLLAADDETLLARHGRWYIHDRDPRWLRRNALIVLGNIGDPDDVRVRATIERYLDDPDPILRTHARWAADRLHR